MKAANIHPLLLGTVIACLGWASCKGPEEVYDYDKAAILEDVAHGQILPHLGYCLSATDSLASAIGHFCQKLDTASLTVARQQWVQAALRWKASEAFDFGLARDRYVHSRIGKWPTDVGIITSKIGSGAVMDSTFFEGLGATSRGLYALEYLLFSHDASTTLNLFTTDSLAGPRGLYLQGLAGNLVEKTRELHSLWSASGDNYAHEFGHSTASGLQDPMGLLVNAMISMLEEVTKTKIGKPFGKFDLGILQPDAVESTRANVSLELVRANVAALEAVYVGGSTTGLDRALDDLHARYGEAALSTTIAQQFATVRHALDAITVPLQDALISQHDQVEAAYQALKALIVLFKSDMCSAMSITVTVSDTDGD